METLLLDNLAQLRTVIGYLGEKEQYAWWQSSFFTEGSSAFLSPVFSRTQILAQCNGVTRAAALFHDERIGVGRVFHLFRLPEELEQGIHQEFQNARLEEVIRKITSGKESALEFLRKTSVPTDRIKDGPIRVGEIKALYDNTTWNIVAGHYLVSFETQKEILPYFRDQA
jgi:hypothetical protein